MFKNNYVGVFAKEIINGKEYYRIKALKSFDVCNSHVDCGTIGGVISTDSMIISDMDPLSERFKFWVSRDAAVTSTQVEFTTDSELLIFNSNISNLKIKIGNSGILINTSKVYDTTINTQIGTTKIINSDISKCEIIKSVLIRQCKLRGTIIDNSILYNINIKNYKNRPASRFINSDCSNIINKLVHFDVKNSYVYFPDKPKLIDISNRFDCLKITDSQVKITNSIKSRTNEIEKSIIRCDDYDDTLMSDNTTSQVYNFNYCTLSQPFKPNSSQVIELRITNSEYSYTSYSIFENNGEYIIVSNNDYNKGHVFTINKVISNEKEFGPLLLDLYNQTITTLQRLKTIQSQPVEEDKDKPKDKIMVEKVFNKNE